MVSPFPFIIFCSEKMYRDYYVIFLNSFLILTLENIIVISCSGEPSEMSPALNEWLLSSVRGDTGSNPVEAFIFLQASHFL